MVFLDSSLLIIESSVKNSTIYQDYLRSTGCRYKLSIVTSIAEGLDLCRTSDIDTVLLGSSISDLDGLAFLESLAAQDGVDHPTVIIVATEGDPSIAVRAIKLGAEDYLVQRDLTPALLQSAISGGIEKARLQFQLQERKLDDGFTKAKRDEGVRKAAELALQANEQRYRALIDITAQIVWNADADGTIVNSNSGIFTGQSLEELQSQGWMEVIHPDDRQRTREVWLLAVANLTTYKIEHRLRRWDGEYRLMSARAVPLLNADGSVREFAVIIFICFFLKLIPAIHFKFLSNSFFGWF